MTVGQADCLDILTADHARYHCRRERHRNLNARLIEYKRSDNHGMHYGCLRNEYGLRIGQRRYHEWGLSWTFATAYCLTRPTLLVAYQT